MNKIYILQSEPIAIEASDLEDLNKKLNERFGADNLEHYLKVYTNNLLCNIYRITQIKDLPEFKGKRINKCA